MKRFRRIFEVVVIFLAVLVCIQGALEWNGPRPYNCPGTPLHPGGACVTPLAFIELGLLLFAVFTALWLLWKDKELQEFFSLWKRQIAVLIFVGLALLSVVWSVAPVLSTFRVLTLFLATFLAGYLGYRYSLREFSGILATCMGIMAALSLMAALLLPGQGTMTNIPYGGAWRGIFWHRNYLGTFMSMGGMIFLIRALSGKIKPTQRLINLAFYLLCLALVMLSRSATGILSIAGLSVVVLLAFAWSKVAHRLSKRSLWIIGGLFAAALLALALNLDAIFNLLGRNATLTGRIPMWAHLVEVYVKPRIYVGYGYDAFWGFAQVRDEISAAVGWRYPVLIGDNGWMDVLLHLGVIGLASFMAVLGVMAVRMAKYALREQTIEAFLPIGVLLFALVGNISLSLFIDPELFTWLVLIAILVLVTQKVDPVSKN